MARIRSPGRYLGHELKKKKKGIEAKTMDTLLRRKERGRKA